MNFTSKCMLVVAFAATTSLAQAGTLPDRLPLGLSRDAFLEMAVTNSPVVFTSVTINPGNALGAPRPHSFQSFRDYEDWIVKEGMEQHAILKATGKLTDQTIVKISSGLSVKTAWENCKSIILMRTTTFGEISESSFRDMPVFSSRIPVYVKDLYRFEVRIEKTPDRFISSPNASTLLHYFWEDNRGKLLIDALNFKSIGEPMPNVIELDIEVCTTKYPTRTIISTKNWGTGKVESATYTQSGERVSIELKIQKDFLSLDASAGSFVVLQESKNMKDWFTIYELQNQSGPAQLVLPIYNKSGSPQKVFRALAY